MKLMFNSTLVPHYRGVRAKIWSRRFSQLLRKNRPRVSVTRRNGTFHLKPSKNGILPITTSSNDGLAVGISKGLLTDEELEQLTHGIVKVKVRFSIKPEEFGFDMEPFSYNTNTNIPREYYLSTMEGERIEKPILIPAVIYSESKPNRKKEVLSVYIPGLHLSRIIGKQMVDIKVLSIDPFILFLRREGNYKLCVNSRRLKLNCQKLLDTFSNDLVWKEKTMPYSDVWVLCDMKEWNFSLDDVFMRVPSECKLAEKLISRGLLVGKCSIKRSRFGADLTIFNKKLTPRALVEVTELKKMSHEVHGGSGTSRLYELIKAVLSGYVEHGFLVIHSSWEKLLYPESEFVEKHGVHIIFTDYSKGWEKKASKKILRTL